MPPMNRRSVGEAFAALALVSIIAVAATFPIACFGPSPPKPARQVDPSLPAEPVFRPGDDFEKFAADLRAWQAAQLASIKARAEVEKANRSGAADRSFLDNVRGFAFWFSVALVVVAVGMVVVGFIPWLAKLTGLDWRDGMFALGLVAVTQVGAHFLLRWGILASNIAAWVLLAALIVGTATIGVPLGVAFVKRRLGAGARRLASEGSVEPAVAILAASKGLNGPRHKEARAKLRETLAGAVDAGSAGG